MPRMRRTVPFGSSRAVTDGSRRNDRIAAMEVMGPLMSTPPPLGPASAIPYGQRDSLRPTRFRTGQRDVDGTSSGRSVSATSDQIGDPADLGLPLGGALRLVVVVHGRADQRRGRAAGAGPRREEGGDQ